MRKTFLLLLCPIFAILLDGCCSVTIIHPPSATAFMDVHEDSTTIAGSGSFYWGDIDNYSYITQFIDNTHYVTDKVSKSVELSEESWEFENNEWLFEFALNVLRTFHDHFRYGFGLDFFTPYIEAGFVSDYLGIMGWSNLCLWQFEKYEHAYFQWGGGISLIEQLPLGDNFRIGITQHLSRNGREAYRKVEFGSINKSYPAPIFYDEIGFGGYISAIPYEKTRVGIEFRYGRDLTYKRLITEDNTTENADRYSITLTFSNF